LVPLTTRPFCTSRQGIIRVANIPLVYLGMRYGKIASTARVDKHAEDRYNLARSVEVVPNFRAQMWAVGAVVAHFVDIEGVTGSNPVLPTIERKTLFISLMKRVFLWEPYMISCSIPMHLLYNANSK
jgi:hypothetical protein